MYRLLFIQTQFHPTCSNTTAGSGKTRTQTSLVEIKQFVTNLTGASTVQLYRTPTALLLEITFNLAEAALFSLDSSGVSYNIRLQNYEYEY